jgi:WS/DGAT/MGAT family acyltransferase
MDATFLYLETPAGHMHVAMTAIYDASSVDGGYSFERIRATIEERLPLVPPFRRRLVAVPFQFHHPVWIEDPDFHLDDHVHRVVCPAPGGRRELALIAGRIASEPLDRSRPLWEAWVIEGLKHDRFGFVIKVHHSAVDGAAGAEIMTRRAATCPRWSRSPPSTFRPTSNCSRTRRCRKPRSTATRSA